MQPADRTFRLEASTDMFVREVECYQRELPIRLRNGNGWELTASTYDRGRVGPINPMVLLDHGFRAITRNSG